MSENLPNKAKELTKLELELRLEKAEAYDILASIENLNSQYKNAHTQLQQQLKFVNSKIQEKLNLLQQQDEKEKAEKAALADSSVIASEQQLLNE